MGVDLETGVLKRHESCSSRKLDIPVHLSDFSRVDKSLRVKVVNFAGNLRGER
jgi:hypothetical protein